MAKSAGGKNSAKKKNGAAGTGKNSKSKSGKTSKSKSKKLAQEGLSNKKKLEMELF